MAVFKANSRNAALLEEFLIRRASSSTPNTVEGDEAAAEEAIANSRIERRTGEMSQVEPTATVPGSAPTAATATGPGTGNVAAAHAAQDKTAAKKRGWYGWGSGGGAQQPAPGAATATTATSRTNATAPTSSTAVVR